VNNIASKLRNFLIVHRYSKPIGTSSARGNVKIIFCSSAF
jgi:hypothetical protein